METIIHYVKSISVKPIIKIQDAFYRSIFIETDKEEKFELTLFGNEQDLEIEVDVKERREKV